MPMPQNLSVKEFVCQHVWDKYGNNAIKFLDPLFLEVMDVVRNKILNIPIVINKYSSNLTQRGLRCNCCQLVADKTKQGKVYLSAHNFGKGCDFSSGVMTTEQIHKAIIAKQDLLPCKIRLESTLDAKTWCHLDIMTEGQKDKIYVFRA